MSAGDFEPAARLLAGIIRGAVTAWPAGPPERESDLVEAAERHGVAPLAWRAVARAADAWPAALVARLGDRARAETALSIARQRELARVLQTLNAADVRTLVIKGAHLASAVYEAPDLRPRRDTDLLIDERDRGRARQAFERLGYEYVPHVTGDLVMPQFHFRREEPSGVAHQLDAHWRLAAPHAFASLPAFGELWEAGLQFWGGGSSTRAPSLPHALLIACVHRVAHHVEPGALIWIVDVHRIVERMTADDAGAFLQAVERAQVRAVAARALWLARQLFASRLPAAITSLADEPNAPGELSARFLWPHRRKVDELLLDLRALGSWRSRVKLLREHLFPPASYMRATSSSRAPLSFLYLRRALGGAVRWLRE